jgi:hypothetical protein
VRFHCNLHKENGGCRSCIGNRVRVLLFGGLHLVINKIRVDVLAHHLQKGGQ